MFGLEHFHALREREMVRHLAEVAQGFIRHHSQSLEQQYLASDVQADFGDAPGTVPQAQISLPHPKSSALVEPPEDPPPKSDLAEKSAIEARDALALRVNQQITLHSHQHLLHMRGRRVIWIGLEVQLYQWSTRVARPRIVLLLFVRSGVFVQERIRQRLQDLQ